MKLISGFTTLLLTRRNLQIGKRKPVGWMSETDIVFFEAAMARIWALDYVEESLLHPACDNSMLFFIDVQILDSHDLGANK